MEASPLPPPRHCRRRRVPDYKALAEPESNRISSCDSRFVRIMPSDGASTDQVACHRRCALQHRVKDVSAAAASPDQERFALTSPVEKLLAVVSAAVGP
jgi:hypothetical protein